VSEKLIEKIRMKKAHIAVLGLGHVGLPTAAIFADAGYSVTGTDVRNEVVNAISSLKLDTQEPRLYEMIRRVVGAGKLKAIVDTVLATKQADVILICVQTPLNESGEPDLSYLERASRDVAEGLAKGNLVVVVSTVPPGTVKNLVAAILKRESGLKFSDFWLAYCPERILPGKTMQEFTKNARIIGGFNLESAEIAAELFNSVTKGKILIADCLSAEVAKLAENTFRDVNIAFANELALICEQVGADVAEVIRLANTHPRVNIHKPACGVGGPCLTKDPCLLLHSVEKRGYDSRLIRPSRELNDYMPDHTVKLLIEALTKAGKNVQGSKIVVLGTAYKGEVGDPTNSPAEKIICKLLDLGAQVVVYDPYCKESFGAERVEDLLKAVDGADCVLVTTDHRIFKELNLEEIKALMNEKPIIVDGKRIFDPEQTKNLGFAYYGIGYGS